MLLLGYLFIHSNLSGFGQSLFDYCCLLWSCFISFSICSSVCVMTVLEAVATAHSGIRVYKENINFQYGKILSFPLLSSSLSSCLPSWLRSVSLCFSSHLAYTIERVLLFISSPLVASICLTVCIFLSLQCWLSLWLTVCLLSLFPFSEIFFGFNYCCEHCLLRADNGNEDFKAIAKIVWNVIM